MKSESTLANGEKPYEPPRITTISLRPEEAVLGACKSFSISGSTSGFPCSVTFCKAIGS